MAEAPLRPPGPLVFILPSLAGGGAERVTLSLLQGCSEAGHPCHLLLLDRSGPLAMPNIPGVAVDVIGRPRLRAAWPSLIGRLRRLAPRAVVSSFGHINLLLAGAAGRLYRPGRLILREANLPSLSLHRWPRPRLARRLYRRLYRRADLVIASSARMAAEFRDDFAVPADRLAVLDNPVDAAALRQRARPMRRHPGAGRRFVAIGRLVHQKGIDRLVALWDGLAPDDHLTVIGEGPERPALARAIGCRGLDGRIALAGWQADAPAWLAGADALLLPSRWEGMPNAALEALALGVPVVATPETGGLGDLLAEMPADGLTIAAAGAPFAEAVAAVPSRGTAPAPAACLLPPRFERAAVVARFLALVEGT